MGRISSREGLRRPELAREQALLRPGRLDVLVRVGPPSTPAEQAQVLAALTRKFDLSPDVSLSDVAARCPIGLSGADYYALCADAMVRAIQEGLPEAQAVAAQDGADGSGSESDDGSEDDEADGGQAAGAEGQAVTQAESVPPPVVAARHFDAAVRSLLGSREARPRNSVDDMARLLQEEIATQSC